MSQFNFSLYFVYSSTCSIFIVQTYNDMETQETKQFNFQIPVDLKNLLDEAATKKSTTMTQYLIDLLVSDLKGVKQKELLELDAILVQAKRLIAVDEKPHEWDYQGLQNNPNFYGIQRDWNHNLLSVINKKSSEAFKVRNQNVNKLVIHSAPVFNILLDISYLEVNALRKNDSKVGTLGSRYDVHFELGRTRPNAIDLFNNDTFLDEVLIKNLPTNYPIENNVEPSVQWQSWDYNGMKDCKNFFGTQKDWNSTLPQVICDKAYTYLLEEPSYLQVEVFSTKMFDMFMHCGALSDVVIDRLSAISKAEIKDKMIYLFLNELVPEKENILTISKTDGPTWRTSNKIIQLHVQNF